MQKRVQGRGAHGREGVPGETGGGEETGHLRDCRQVLRDACTSLEYEMGWLAPRNRLEEEQINTPAAMQQQQYCYK